LRRLWRLGAGKIAAIFRTRLHRRIRGKLAPSGLVAKVLVEKEEIR
jgi:hypothetical protein